VVVVVPKEVPIRLARLVTSCLLFAGVSWGGIATARDAAPAPVAYRAPASCPSAEEFSAQVAARTPLFLGDGDLSIRVELFELPQGLRGRVELVRAGKVTAREIDAERCAELVEALSLVVAILIDPNADTRPVPVGAPAEAPVPAPPPRRVVPLPGPKLASPDERWPDDADVEAGEPTEKPPRRWAIEAGSGVVAEGAVAPGLVVGPRVFVGAWFEQAVPITLDLSAARLWSGTITGLSSGSASMVLDVLRLDACVFEWKRSVFSVEPCVGVEAGVLRVEGTHPAGPSSHNLFWGSAGAELRGSVWYRDLLRVSAEVGAGVPFVHYRLSFQGEPPIHETPPVGLFLGFGLAVRFP